MGRKSVSRLSILFPLVSFQSKNFISMRFKVKLLEKKKCIDEKNVQNYKIVNKKKSVPLPASVLVPGFYVSGP